MLQLKIQEFPYKQFFLVNYALIFELEKIGHFSLIVEVIEPLQKRQCHRFYHE